MRSTAPGKNRTNRSLWIVGILVIFQVLLLNGASAQEPTPSDDQVNSIARQLYCPVCENVPLDVCPTQACHQWRELIRQMLADGKSEAEIKQFFVDNYGARVLSEPPASGLNWLVYIVPPAAFLVGVFLLFMALRTWKMDGQTQNATSPSQTGSLRNSKTKSTSTGEKDYTARLEEELRKRR